LAPGYDVQKESLEVHYVGGAPARLTVRAAYQLRNVGNSKLTWIETTLPKEEVFGRQNLRVLIDNRAVTPQPVAEEKEEDEDENRLRQMWSIPFDPPWPQKEKRSLLIEYDLAPAPPGVAAIAVNGGSFHLRPFGWFPVLQAPEKLFAHDVVRPNPTPVSIVVPQGYLAIAAGDLVSARPQGAEVEYRFLLRKFDLDPFVVAGRYSEQQVRAKDGTIIFWTLAPLSSDAAKEAGARLASTWKAYETAFGSIGNEANPFSPHIVETLAQIPAPFASEGSPAGRAFLGGVLLNQPAFALGVTDEEFLSIAERALAQSWVGEQIILTSQGEMMGLGFAEYAPIVATEARGGEAARRAAVETQLRAYDNARAKVVEKPISMITRKDSWELRHLASFKVTLFFIALEDRCGEAPVREGIAHMVRALRGETGGFSELRSAIEQQTGQDLGEFFRSWLDQTGIPADFRERYEEKSGS
jgi:hypothetical protein